MFCGKCGSSIPDGNSFCSKCGAPLSPDIIKSAANTNPQPIPPAQQTAKPQNKALRVIESIFAIAFAIIVILIAMRACSTGMFQMGLL